ncbi:MAG: hypothetical protein FWC10_03675 [Lentimicrobiaceae bacterium]|nr:hypothetical protein [Lentimicrobiaceae bacterium]
MDSHDLISNEQAILDETGGDKHFSDLFIETAKQSAEEVGGHFSQSCEVVFRNEVDMYRKNWERKKKFLL